ncbi:MAG: hypothetical protein WKG32_17755 [Gemmatimonadaceae bacterium]
MTDDGDTSARDDRVDFSPLVPPAERVDRAVDAVMARVAASPRRARAPGARGELWGELAAALRPALAAAAVIVAASAASLLYASRAERAAGIGGAARAGDVSDAVGLPAPVAAWVAGGAAPTAGDVVVFTQGYR